MIWRNYVTVTLCIGKGEHWVASHLRTKWHTTKLAYNNDDNNNNNITHFYPVKKGRNFRGNNPAILTTKLVCQLHVMWTTFVFKLEDMQDRQMECNMWWRPARLHHIFITVCYKSEKCTSCSTVAALSHQTSVQNDYWPCLQHQLSHYTDQIGVTENEGKWNCSMIKKASLENASHENVAQFSRGKKWRKCCYGNPKEQIVVLRVGVC